MPTVTDRHPDPPRLDDVERMIGRGISDTEIVKRLTKKYDCCPNTIRADIKRVWSELREDDIEKRTHRRNVLRFQLETLQSETRDAIDMAEDENVAALNRKTAAGLFGRLCSLDGVDEAERVKLEILRSKMLGDLPPQEFDAMLKAELGKLLDEMPVEELEAKLAARKGAQP